MADIERLIHKRYQLHHILTQGQICTIYLAFDQVLQRDVAVKIIPAQHIAAYKASIRLTAQFSHPNIIGTYDFIQEPETLYLVQEYVAGDEFGVLLQTQLSPSAVADFGVQVCQALLYAGSSTHNVCHGDLTPSAVVRDRHGLVRIGGFALPSDMHYFTSWSLVGGDGNAMAMQELPWGHTSDARRADDTRALGLLLYQLLSGRAPGATSVEPPTDGRLRFLRNVPVELCEIIARTVVRQHPQHINTPEVLYEELRKQLETLEPVVEFAPSSGYQPEDTFRSRPLVPSSSLGVPSAGKLVTALPIRETGQGGANLSTFQSEMNAPIMAMEQQTPQPAFTQTVADMPLKLATARPYPGYPRTDAHPARRLSLPALIFLCLLIFVAFFVIGYFVAHAILP
ncbi:MAG: hypothetical protein NVSMB38_41780 [Ktedonobacteraceae bacterium]